MSYWSKQVIAREVELEKMRRAKPKVAEGLPNASPKQKKVAVEAGAAKALPNHLQCLVPKAIKAPKPSLIVSCRSNVMNHFLALFDFQVSKDFFGRVTSKASVTASQMDGEIGHFIICHVN